MFFLQPRRPRDLRNPTNGSWWIVQILSTNTVPPSSRESHQRQLVDRSDPFYKHGTPEFSGIPPTAVGGSFRSFLQTRYPRVLGNPTNGSWWIVQILSTTTVPPSSLESHQRQLVDLSDDQTFYLSNVRQIF